LGEQRLEVAEREWQEHKEQQKQQAEEEEFNPKLRQAMESLKGRPDGAHRFVYKTKRRTWNHLILWKEDIRKLHDPSKTKKNQKNTNTSESAPMFDLPMDATDEKRRRKFRLKLKAKTSYQSKGGRTFQKGKGGVHASLHHCGQEGGHLSAEDLCPVSLRIAVGSTDWSKADFHTLPDHDFNKFNTASFMDSTTGHEERWNLYNALDEDNKWIVAIEVRHLPHRGDEAQLLGPAE